MITLEIFMSFVYLLGCYLGIYAFQHMKLLYRIFFFQLLIYIPFFILAAIIRSHLFNGISHNNQWVYNMYMPLETAVLAWAGYEYFKTKKAKLLISAGYVVFLIVFLSEICINGIMIFCNYGYITESVLLLVIFLLVLNEHFKKPNNTWKTSPLFWVSMGIILYFGGVIPYLSLINYLQVGHPKINLILDIFILEGLGDLRYILLAVGFWLICRNAVKKISIPNE